MKYGVCENFFFFFGRFSWGWEKFVWANGEIVLYHSTGM